MDQLLTTGFIAESTVAERLSDHGAETHFGLDLDDDDLPEDYLFGDDLDELEGLRLDNREWTRRAILELEFLGCVIVERRETGNVVRLTPHGVRRLPELRARHGLRGSTSAEQSA